MAPFAEDASRGAALLTDVFHGGCVGETRAAHRALERAAAAPLAPMRSHFERIAADESRHAALAFRTAGWLIDAFDELRPRLAVLSEDFVATASADDRLLFEPLLAHLER